jgi:hypothetical protein
MAENYSKLDLVWRVRLGGSGRTRREYLEFVIDGQILSESHFQGDLIGCLGWLPAESQKIIIEELLAKRCSVLENDRYPIYVCPECGDIGCGAITVQIIETDDAYIWQSFGYENNYDKSMSDFDSYKGVGPFCFRKDEYLHVLEYVQKM